MILIHDIQSYRI